MEWLKYLLEVSVCNTLFFGFYFLILRKLTFFSFNRFYLLVVLLMSFLIPALQFNLQRKMAPVKVVQLRYHPALKFNPSVPLEFTQPLKTEYYPEKNAVINFTEVLPFVYGIISLILLLINGWRLVAIIKHTGKYAKNYAGLKVVQKATGFTNCSFFNYVFIDQQNLNDSELQVLLQHEQVHARQFHSADKILLMIFKSILWFNPVIYLYDQALEEVHEYEADEVTSAGIGNQPYALLMLKLAVAKAKPSLIHHFARNPIKDRIEMLFHSKSTGMKKLIYLLAVPVTFGLVWIFAVQVVYAEAKMVVQTKQKIITQVIPKPTHLISRNSFKKPVKLTSIANDSISEKITVVPKILSYQKLAGDLKNKISYLKGGVIQIGSGILKGEDVVYDQLKNTIVAKGASFEKDGKIETGDRIVFDLIQDTYSVLQPVELDILAKDALIDKINYRADSLRYSKSKAIIYLFGHAELSFSQTKISGSKIVYNSLTKIIIAHQAEILSGAKKAIKTDSIFYDLKTSKVKLYGTELNR